MTLKPHHFVAALALVMPASAIAATPILVHRDPGCGCCEKWAAQVKSTFGREVRMVDDTNRAAFKKVHGVPADLASCHTAVVAGLAFEGHVPIADGMRAQAYDVTTFGASGRKVFARHPGI